MANRTKIIVIRKKELLLSVALILLITVLLLTFLCFMHKSPAPTEEASPTMAYVPGVYTATITMGDTPMNVEVVVDENNINAISIKNLDEAMETMYPLVAPAMENLSAQILSSQSVDEVTYPESNQYTSMVLHQAIRSALDKGRIAE